MSKGGGYVYVLTNKTMPGLVKIGYTRRSARSRGFEMYEKHTGVPAPFDFEFEVWCENPEQVESLVFDRLDGFRENKYREFFRVEVDYAIPTILGAVADEFGMRIDDVDFSLDEATAPFLVSQLEDIGESAHEIEVVEALNDLSAQELLPALRRVRERRRKRLAALKRAGSKNHETSILN